MSSREAILPITLGIPSRITVGNKIRLRGLSRIRESPAYDLLDLPIMEVDARTKESHARNRTPFKKAVAREAPSATRQGCQTILGLDPEGIQRHRNKIVLPDGEDEINALGFAIPAPQGLPRRIAYKCIGV